MVPGVPLPWGKAAAGVCVQGTTPLCPQAPICLPRLGHGVCQTPNGMLREPVGCSIPGWVRVAGEAILVTASLASRVLQPKSQEAREVFSSF